MKLKKYIWVILSLFLLTACSTTEDTSAFQYLLPYPNDVHAITPPLPVHTKTIRLKSISMPSYLQKQNIVLVDNNGQVYQATNHLWAESIERQLEPMTLTYLSSRLPYFSWLSPSQYQITSSYLTINIEKFYANQEGVITVAGYWTLWTKNNELSQQKRFNYSRKMTHDGYLAMTKTLSKTWFKNVIEGLITNAFMTQP